MNVLISGASGYLAKKIVEKFLTTDNQILVILRSQNSFYLHTLDENKPQVLFLTDPLFEQKISDFNPDVVYSTTCCYETESNFLDKTIDANYVFPAYLLRIITHIKRDQRIRFISIGSSLPPALNLYSLTKYQFSEIGRFFAGNGKVQFINVLLESFYGPGEPDNRFISRSIKQLRNNDTLYLTEGYQKRDYIHVNDVVDVLLYLANCCISFDEQRNFITVPVGTGIAPSIREIITFLKLYMNSDSVLNFGSVPLRPNEPNTMADLTILRNLGYNKEFILWQQGMISLLGEYE